MDVTEKTTGAPSDVVLNNQRKVGIDAAAIRDFLTEAKSAAQLSSRSVSVVFISDPRMKQLNSFFRGKDSTTDVLSFPHEPDEFDTDTANLGDVVISAEQAARQSKENKLTLENEIKQLILHGLLHLCGYDHETDNGEMTKRELELRRKLKI